MEIEIKWMGWKSWDFRRPIFKTAYHGDVQCLGFEKEHSFDIGKIFCSMSWWVKS